MPESIQYIRTRKLRGLAVTTATRSEVLPDIPTLGDFLNGYEMTGWLGVGVPTNTPSELVEKLNREINGGLADLTMKARLAVDVGYTPFVSSPADFRKFIAEETEKWGKVIRAAHIKAG
jgi:tripartite-type tricarboxylate transporter receptor subunit TctC